MPSVCNFERLRDITMGDDEFAGELVRVFLDDSAAQLERLRVAVERADCGEAAEVAHRLKGAGGNVGAEVLAEVCRVLEASSRQGSTAGLSEGLLAIDRELARARALFQAELGVG